MNAFDEVNQFFDRAADRLGLDDGTRELLKKPWRELTVSVPVRMDDGTIKVFNGYRIQHNAVRGPLQGGNALSSRCRCQRGAGARVPHDVEDSRR